MGVWLIVSVCVYEDLSTYEMPALSLGPLGPSQRESNGSSGNWSIAVKI